MTPIEVAETDIFRVVETMKRWEIARDDTGYCYLRVWAKKWELEILRQAAEETGCTIIEYGCTNHRYD
jgi:hypothetical protein